MHRTDPESSSNSNSDKVLGLMGAVIVIGCVIWLVKTTWFVLHASSATGKVLRIETFSGEGDVYRPVIMFVDAGAVERTLRPGVGWAWTSYSVGQMVRILYDPKDSAQAEVDSFRRLWVRPIVPLCLGFLLASLPWLERRHRRRAPSG